MQYQPDLEKSRLLRLRDVLELIPVSKTTWWAGVKSGKYPQSCKLGRCTFWKSEDIRKLILRIEESSEQGDPNG